MRRVRLPTVVNALVALAAAVAVSAPGAAQVPALRRASDNDTITVRPATARIAYGSDSLQFGDLRLPDGPGPFPVAIVIHGGCWLSRYDLRNSTGLADALRDNGIATWNIEYRRIGNVGGGWPGTFNDVGAAADHLRTLATRYPLDLSRVVAVGHSAGGQLALWLAGAAKVNAISPVARRDPLPLKGVVAIAGVADLADFRTYETNSCGRVIDALMGGTPDSLPERYRAVSPIHLFPLPVPQVQVVGTLDRVMPERARNAHEAAARSAGSAFELIVLEGAGHHEPMAPSTSAGQAVIAAVRKALGIR